MLAEFNSSKKEELQKVEQFIQILNDWIEETAHDIENEPIKTTKKSSKKIDTPQETPKETAAETNYALYGTIAAVALAVGIFAFKHKHLYK